MVSAFAAGAVLHAARAAAMKLDKSATSAGDMRIPGFDGDGDDPGSAMFPRTALRVTLPTGPHAILRAPARGRARSKQARAESARRFARPQDDRRP